MKDLKKKREDEIKVVGQMIEIYCKAHHKSKQLCEECQDLYDYAIQRVNHCPFMETKTFCSNCKVHCYKPEYREKIKEVMRFAGPRMLFVHPILAIKHVIEMKKEKKAQKNQ